MKKNSFCLSSKNSFLKDKVKTAYWVGQWQLISLGTQDFFKRTPVFYDIQASVTVNTMKQSVFEKKIIQIYYKKKKKM